MGRLQDFMRDPWNNPMTAEEWEIGRDSYRMGMEAAKRIADEESTVVRIREKLQEVLNNIN